MEKQFGYSDWREIYKDDIENIPLQTNSNMETQELKKENIEKALKDLENIDFTKPIL